MMYPNRTTGKSTPRSQSGWGDSAHARADTLDVSAIQFDPIEADLFDSVARQVAETLASNSKSNKPTQLRRFYDEVCLWNEKVESDETKFQELLPFIRMMNAKAAYAKGRNMLVDDNFVKLMRVCLEQVKDPQTMRYFKLFMEAVMGFYKALRTN